MREFTSLLDAEQKLWPDGHPDDKLTPQTDPAESSVAPKEARAGRKGPPIKVPSGWLVVALVKIEDVMEGLCRIFRSK